VAELDWRRSALSENRAHTATSASGSSMNAR
jgi:hypothetical protein